MNFVGSTHIGLLLHGIVNITILADHLPDNFIFDEDEDGEEQY